VLCGLPFIYISIHLNVGDWHHPTLLIEVAARKPCIACVRGHVSQFSYIECTANLAATTLLAYPGMAILLYTWQRASHYVVKLSVKYMADACCSCLLIVSLHNMPPRHAALQIELQRP
jgi:hypothetical protein